MYSIRFIPQAEIDLEEAFGYIKDSLHNPKAAKELILELEAKLERLKTFPNSAPLLNNRDFNFRSIRFMIIKNYTAYLKIEEETKIIFVLRFLYSKRNLIKLLDNTDG